MIFAEAEAGLWAADEAGSRDGVAADVKAGELKDGSVAGGAGPVTGAIEAPGCAAVALTAT